jgi:hypothetical protein
MRARCLVSMAPVADLYRTAARAGSGRLDRGHGALGDLDGRLHPQFLDTNRRGVGKSQSKWTAYTMETQGSSTSPSCMSTMSGLSSTALRCSSMRAPTPLSRAA